MNNIKHITCQCIAAILFIVCVNISEAAPHYQVAVMDFGTHKGAATADINLTNAEKAACDYIIERLVEVGSFDVMDKEIVQEQLTKEGLKTSGLIDPETAQRIGRMLGAKYIIYGNVADVTASDTGTQILASGVTVHTVKSHIIARMMDVDTGDIVMAAKGQGSSKSSLAKVGYEMYGYITIGSKKVSQVSVHNALQKAAYNAVDILVQRLEAKK